MQFLRDYAERDDNIRRLIVEAAALPTVQGVLLDADPTWLRWIAFVRYAGRDRANRIADRWDYRYFGSYPLTGRFGAWLADRFSFPPVPLPGPIEPNDLHDLPPWWREYSESLGWSDSAEQPITVKVALRPEVGSETPALPTEGLRVVFERRPLAYLTAGPRSYTRPLIGGVSIGVGRPSHGTLGGIVTDGSTYFGVTCAHVVQSDGLVVEQPAQADSRKAGRIGVRAVGTPIQPSALGDPCNPYSTTTQLNDLDLALIELDSTVACRSVIRGIGAVTGIIPKKLLNPGQRVEFSGKASEHQQRVLGASGAFYRLNDHAGNHYCFRNLVEVRHPTRSIASRNGDSGAWVCSPYGGGYGWYGLLIGGDYLQSYMCLAEDLEQWWTACGLTLRV